MHKHKIDSIGLFDIFKGDLIANRLVKNLEYSDVPVNYDKSALDIASIHIEYYWKCTITTLVYERNGSVDKGFIEMFDMEFEDDSLYTLFLLTHSNAFKMVEHSIKLNEWLMMPLKVDTSSRDIVLRTDSY
jgi:GTP-sensing pleiotropic transcriptional regulator CodY